MAVLGALAADSLLGVIRQRLSTAGLPSDSNGSATHSRDSPKDVAGPSLPESRLLSCAPSQNGCRTQGLIAPLLSHRLLPTIHRYSRQG